MLNRWEWRRFGLEVCAGLVSAAVLYVIALILSAEISVILLGFAGMASVLAATTSIAWLRAHRQIATASALLAKLEQEATQIGPELRHLEGRLDEAERRAGLAESQCVDAQRHAEVAEQSTRDARSEKREVEAAYAVVERWEQLESWTGLTDCWKQLEGSDQHPRDKLSEISTNLDFMGHGGSKWTKERDQFSEMLTRIGNNRGLARMLLLNPDCEISRRKSKIRFGRPDDLPQKIASSLLVIKDMQETYDNLHIKLYSHMPHFRVTIVDRRVAILGHYRSYDRDSSGTPLLAWNNEADWSFFQPFFAYFEHEWSVADEVDWDCVESIARPWERV